MIRTKRHKLSVRPRTAANEYRVVTVGTGKQYGSIEAAFDALAVIAPDPTDPVLVLLDPGTWVLTDPVIACPDGTGILAADPTVANTSIVGAGGLGQTIGIFQIGAGHIFEGFTVGPGTSTSGCNFQTVRPAAVLSRFSRLVCLDQGDDVITTRHAGHYLIDRCDITAKWDGLSVFTDGAPVATNIMVRNSCLRTGTGENWHHAIRVDNAGAELTVENSLIESAANSAPDLYGACIISGGLSPTPAPYRLRLKNTTLRTTVPSGYAGNAVFALWKVGGQISADRCHFALNGSPRQGTDYAVALGANSDLDGNGFTNCTIAAAGMTGAQAQREVDANTVTGFPIA